METLLFVLFIVILVALTALAIMTISNQKKLANAEAEVRQQHQNLRYELYAKLRPLEEALYNQQAGDEKILYDGSVQIASADFFGQGAKAWNYVAHCFENGSGEGSFKIEGNVISVHRINTEGRYELHLHRYSVNGTETSELPSDSSKQKRVLKLQCEVKGDLASHGLRFVFKGKESTEVLDEKDVIVFTPDWQMVTLYFNIPTNEPTHLRIDDLHVLQAPSTVQIRNLVLFEKFSR